MTKIKMTGSEKKEKEVRKPYLTGTVTDENTVRNVLAFFGTLIVVFFVAFIACATAAFHNLILRLVMNLAVIAIALMIFYNNGAGRGAEAVTRGEILYQRKEKGQTFSNSEQKICYHPAKGFVIGIVGTIPFLILALILALNTAKQMTESGTLPSWMQIYTKRADTGSALINYTQPEGMSFIDYIRAVVRICIIPFVNIFGYSDKNAMLILERISPLILMLPAVAYGTGYVSGRKIRTRIHTVISANEAKRIRKAKKRKKAYNAGSRKHEPEQLN